MPQTSRMANSPENVAWVTLMMLDVRASHVRSDEAFWSSPGVSCTSLGERVMQLPALARSLSCRALLVRAGQTFSSDAERRCQPVAEKQGGLGAQLSIMSLHPLPSGGPSNRRALTIFRDGLSCALVAAF